MAQREDFLDACGIVEAPGLRPLVRSARVVRGVDALAQGAVGGISAEKEAEVLNAWKAQRTGGSNE